MLKNKKVLLIGPLNYNYPLSIKNEIELCGGEVHLYDERNDPNTIEKIVLRIAPQILKGKTELYYKNIIRREQEFHPDFVLFISPESVTSKIIQMLKKTFINAQFILYMWDSMGNKNAKSIYKHFDKKFSFDKADCMQYKMQFRPLFFSREYDSSEKKDVNYKYDFGFIGTTHSDRAKIMYKIYQSCEKNKRPYYFYLYVPGKFMYIVRSIQDSYFRKMSKLGFVHTSEMERDKVEKIMEQTRYVVDVNHPNQSGLTMRTIEMVGLKRKLLTTNPNIKTYDFYNPVNQIVIDRERMKIDKSIIEKPYQEIDREVYLKYRVDGWVRDVFGGLDDGTEE